MGNYVSPDTIPGHELSGSTGNQSSSLLIPAPIASHIYAGEPATEVSYPHVVVPASGSIYARPSKVVMVNMVTGSSNVIAHNNCDGTPIDYYFLFSGSSADATDINNYTNFGNVLGSSITSGSQEELNIQPIAWSSSLVWVADAAVGCINVTSSQMHTGSVIFYYDHKLK